MKTTTFTQPNYRSNYIAMQLQLPMEIEKVIDPKDEVYSFAEAMKGIDLSQYLKKKKHRGNPGYCPTMMFNVMMFAEMEGKNSDLRELEKLCKTDLRYMLLSREQTPSHMAFQRFEQNVLKKAMREIFAEIAEHLCDQMGVNREIQYIDGTKLEANAYKNSFVYKTRVLHARERLNERVTEAIIQLNQKYGYAYPYHWNYASQEIGYIAQYLMEVMVREGIPIQYGRGKRKTEWQQDYDEFLGYAMKLREYEENLFLCGIRNSYSKTDPDATMMNTKYDYYNQTGVSKPCYNLQIGVSDGLVMNAGLYQTPGDTKTFIPFMEQFYQLHGYYPKWPIADAGYGSYWNYFYCLEKGMNLGMKYNYYAKKEEPKFKKKIYNMINWKENEKGEKICPQGQVFNQYLYDKREEEGKYLKLTQVYGCKGCGTCPVRKECTQGKRRTISRNPILEEFQQKVDENLRSAEGQEMKKQRSIQAEGTFGVMKQDRLYTRIKRRGKDNAEMEVLKMLIGFNLRKYHLYRLRKQCQA